jgi:hypothetical protein
MHRQTSLAVVVAFAVVVISPVSQAEPAALAATGSAASSGVSTGGDPSPGGPYASTSEYCKTKLAASYGTLGKGRDIVRRLYPTFDTSTFVVKGDQPFTLLDCDFATRPKPSSGVAIVLQFPSKLLLDNDLRIEQLDTWHDEFLRLEIAEVVAGEDGQIGVARKPDALPFAAISDGRDVMPLLGGVRLDRTVFALNESENAVAVRFGLENACSGHGALLFEYSDLALFRPQGDELRLVLQVTLELTTGQVHCDEDEDCGGSDTEKYILRLAKHKTGGFFDWVHKNVTHPKADRPVTYQWDGNRYVSVARSKKTGH